MSAKQTKTVRFSQSNARRCQKPAAAGISPPFGFKPMFSVIFACYASFRACSSIAAK